MKKRKKIIKRNRKVKEIGKKKQEKIKAGDYVEIKTEKEKFKGIFLPSYDDSTLLIKLDSGYNLGIDKKNLKSLKLIRKRTEESEKQEKIKQNENLNSIGLIVTGGTISARLDYETGGVNWLMSPNQLFEMVPKLKNIVKISKIERPFMMASENMSAKHWKEIAKKAAELLNKKENSGIIITHGTDFLHYTASALSFMLKNLNKPVILTYSQRSTDRGSTDTVLNMTCSAYASISNIAEVILVGHGNSSDDFCLAIRGSKVRKMHSSRRDAFRPINDLPIAKIYENGMIKVINKKYKKREKSDKEKKVIADAVFEEKIALIKFFPGMRAEQINFFIKNKYKGLIIEAAALGHLAIDEAVNNLIPIIKKAIKSGLIICLAPQTLYGRLDPYVYSPGRKLLKTGVIYLEDMLPETAYIKLGWLLGHKNLSKEKVKELMKENLVGEINEKLSEYSFLY